MSVLSFVVYGRPQPAGSKKAFQHPSTGRIVVTDDAKKSRPWKNEVAETALAALDEVGRLNGTLLEGPLNLHVVFHLARPKGHHGSGRNEGVVKASAPAYPAVKPDATKLVRAVEDALTGVVWRDDAQIVSQQIHKIYGTPERVEITVTTLPRTLDADDLRAAA